MKPEARVPDDETGPQDMPDDGQPHQTGAEPLPHKGGMSPGIVRPVSPQTTIVVNRYDNTDSLRCHTLHCCISAFFPPWIFVWMGYCVYDALVEPPVTTTYITSGPPVYVQQIPMSDSRY